MRKPFMKRVAFVGAVLLATLGATTITASAAPKDGDRCTPAQVGKTSGNLTCVKEGNKRRWRVTPAATTEAPTTTAKAGAAAAAPASGGSKEPIKIGVALGVTGASTAGLAQDQKLAAQLAEKFFNDKGGINGRPIKLLIQDTGSDPSGAINAFNTLIDSEKVVGIVGPTLSAQALASDPIADKAKVPVLGPSNTAAGIPQIGDYIARVSAGVASYAANVVKFANKRAPASKGAVFFAQDDAFSRSETGVFQNAIKAEGMELLPPQTFLVNDTDFAQQVQFVQRERPDVVAISGLFQAANLTKQLRDAGYRGTIIGGNGLNTAQTFSVCKQQCDGMLIAQAYSPENGGFNVEFKKAWIAEQKRDPGQIAAQAFTAVHVFVEALKVLEKSGKLDGPVAQVREDLNKAILAGKYNTALGDISFDKDGDVIQAKYFVAQIKMNRGDQSDVFAGKFLYFDQ
jgi:branched-chain amino acid transport system substrate-binding protein